MTEEETVAFYRAWYNYSKNRLKLLLEQVKDMEEQVASYKATLESLTKEQLHKE